ncbi:MAG: long-chain fatty acid--CoA ligase [Deltaproteobacteria bacterium]
MEYRRWHDHYDYEVPLSLRYPRTLVHDILQIPANAHPNKPAILYEGKSITFWELRQMVLRMANALKGLGVEKGDRVGIHLPTCPQYVIAYRAVLSLGAIVVNLNPIYPAEELLVVAKQTTLTTLITIDKALPNVRLLCRDFQIPRVIVANSSDFTSSGGKGNSSDLDKGWYGFMDILDGCTNTDRVRVTIDPEDPAVIQFTGGTTGVPKGAVLTHANVTTATVQISAWYMPRARLTPIERLSTLIVLPLYHVYGNLISNWAIYSCATQILVPQFEINKLMDLIGSVGGITYFPAVPTMVSAVVNHPKAKEMEIGKIIGFMNVGAAPCPVELIEQVKNAGIFLTEGWAMSETSCTGIGNPIMGVKKVGSIGIPLLDTDVKLVDLEDGKTEVPQGEPGEIIIKGPQVMKAYWHNPEETANQLKDGWLYTGDIAVMDQDGYFFIVDRKKDMIIAGGFNVYPREIDELLHKHPKVELAVSVGVPDAYRGETVKAFIVLKNGETASQEEIIAFCKEKLAPYKVPRTIEFRESLPQSAVGKILRKTLRDEEVAKAKG